MRVVELLPEAELRPAFQCGQLGVIQNHEHLIGGRIHKKAIALGGQTLLEGVGGVDGVFADLRVQIIGEQHVELDAQQTALGQQGALLAKGRLLGIQFDVLFTDDLYTKISKNAIDTANSLKKGLAAKGYRFFMDSPTNQVFVILDNAQLAALEGRAKFGFWEKFDDSHTVVRIATSWATRMEEIEQLIALM